VEFVDRAAQRRLHHVLGRVGIAIEPSEGEAVQSREEAFDELPEAVFVTGEYPRRQPCVAHHRRLEPIGSAEPRSCRFPPEYTLMVGPGRPAAPARLLDGPGLAVPSRRRRDGR
jgi:hypothetical protein